MLDKYQMIPQINHIYHNKEYDLIFIVIGKEYDEKRRMLPMYKVMFLNIPEQSESDIKLYSQKASLFHKDHTIEL